MVGMHANHFSWGMREPYAAVTANSPTPVPQETRVNPASSHSPKPPRRSVAVIGAGPGGLSTVLAFHRAGHEVRLFERAPTVQPMGGAGLLSLPVLAVPRDMGVDITNLGAYAVTEFRNAQGRLHARLPFNPRAEARAGLPGWHYGMLRSAAIERMLQALPPT
jgi:2-polyprenyl-6-methoxyphenol hydroxylase-like FAD-dependent oxidoreductase